MPKLSEGMELRIIFSLRPFELTVNSTSDFSRIFSYLIVELSLLMLLSEYASFSASLLSTETSSAFSILAFFEILLSLFIIL